MVSLFTYVCCNIRLSEGLFRKEKSYQIICSDNKREHMYSYSSKKELELDSEKTFRMLLKEWCNVHMKEKKSETKEKNCWSWDGQHTTLGALFRSWHETMRSGENMFLSCKMLRGVMVCDYLPVYVNALIANSWFHVTLNWPVALPFCHVISSFYFCVPEPKVRTFNLIRFVGTGSVDQGKQLMEI